MDKKIRTREITKYRVLKPKFEETPAASAQGSRRLEASIEKGLSNSLAAVLGAKIHPL